MTRHNNDIGRTDPHTTSGDTARSRVSGPPRRWLRSPYWWTSLITFVVLAAVAGMLATATRERTPDNAADPTTLTLPPGWPIPSSAPSGLRPGFGLPTTDLFGRRLETPDDPAGIAMSQEPTRRPNPATPGYHTAAPAGISWQRGWGGAALPLSASDGPAEIRGGVATGFAPTPQGAGLAAYDALARALAAPDGIWQQVIAARFTGADPAPLVARFARSRASTTDPARYVVVPEGFRIREYHTARPDFAVVDIAVRDRSGTAYSSWPMAWTGGDWRVRVPATIEDLWAPARPVTGATHEFGAWR